MKDNETFAGPLVPTALYRRRCRGCRQPLTVRLEVAAAPFQSNQQLPFLCERCLAARVEAVRAGREPEALRPKAWEARHCPKGHLVAGDNLSVSTTPRGTVQRRCRTCRQATSPPHAARPAARQAREGGAAQYSLRLARASSRQRR